MDARVRLVLPRLQPRSSSAARDAYTRRRDAARSRARSLMLGRLRACSRPPTVGLFKAVPDGFVPAQDKQYLIGFAQLPDGATLDRTEEVIRRMSDIALKQPGVEHAVAFPGLSINGFTNSSNAGHRLRDAEALRRAQATRRCRGGAIAVAAEPAVRRRSRTRSSRSSRRRRCRASAPSAASSCRSRTAPRSATRRSTRR